MKLDHDHDEVPRNRMLLCIFHWIPYVCWFIMVHSPRTAAWIPIPWSWSPCDSRCHLLGFPVFPSLRFLSNPNCGTFFLTWSWDDHDLIIPWSPILSGKTILVPRVPVTSRDPSREVCVRSSWPRINCCRRCMRRCCPRAQRKLERGRSVPGWLIPTLEGGGCELENGYGSIPINTIFSGMNIHLPAILMFTRGTRFWHTATSENDDHSVTQVCLAREMMSFFWLRYPSWGTTFGKGMI